MLINALAACGIGNYLNQRDPNQCDEIFKDVNLEYSVPILVLLSSCRSPCLCKSVTTEMSVN